MKAQVSSSEKPQFFQCRCPVGKKTRILLSQLSAALNGQFFTQIIGFAPSFSNDNFVLFGIFFWNICMLSDLGIIAF